MTNDEELKEVVKERYCLKPLRKAEAVWMVTYCYPIQIGSPPSMRDAVKQEGPYRSVRMKSRKEGSMQALRGEERKRRRRDTYKSLYSKFFNKLLIPVN